MKKQQFKPMQDPLRTFCKKLHFKYRSFGFGRKASKRRVLIVAGAVLLLAMGCLNACGAGAKATQSFRQELSAVSQEADSSRGETVMSGDMASGTSGLKAASVHPSPYPGASSGTSAHGEGSLEDTEEALMEDSSDDLTGATSEASAADNSAVGSNEIRPDRKLIRNADLSFETDDFDAFLSDISSETKALGGYIESSDIQGTEGQAASTYASTDRYATFTLRIPSEKLDSFLMFASGKAHLTRKTENTQDVTLQYHDIESRKKALTAEQDRLLELMAQAESMDAVIAIESRLSDIRYQLESLESNLRLYDNQVQYSTVTLSVKETRAFTTGTGDRLQDRIREGLKENTGALVSDAANLMVSIITHLPQILVTLAAVAVFAFAGKKIRKKHLMRRKSQDKTGTPQVPDANASATDDTPKA
ncbi:DUF4349 domain-containing protein [Oribacterium sp. HCP28S3_H8]|uniref:DUF4349 domain-containing protein n=1 Tax=Oribacterium sp. HCP28S3_H8 TaxID=3438945 RepID=UPI003F8A2B22